VRGDVVLWRRSIAESTTPSFVRLSQFLTSKGDGTQRFSWFVCLSYLKQSSYPELRFRSLTTNSMYIIIEQRKDCALIDREDSKMQFVALIRPLQANLPYSRFAELGGE